MELINKYGIINVYLGIHTLVLPHKQGHNGIGSF